MNLHNVNGAVWKVLAGLAVTIAMFVAGVLVGYRRVAVLETDAAVMEQRVDSLEVLLEHRLKVIDELRLKVIDEKLDHLAEERLTAIENKLEELLGAK
jgi:hypothetical protein